MESLMVGRALRDQQLHRSYEQLERGLDAVAPRSNGGQTVCLESDHQMEPLDLSLRSDVIAGEAIDLRVGERSSSEGGHRKFNGLHRRMAVAPNGEHRAAAHMTGSGPASSQLQYLPLHWNEIASGYDVRGLVTGQMMFPDGYANNYLQVLLLYCSLDSD